MNACDILSFFRMNPQAHCHDAWTWFLVLQFGSMMIGGDYEGSKKMKRVYGLVGQRKGMIRPMRKGGF